MLKTKEREPRKNTTLLVWFAPRTKGQSAGGTAGSWCVYQLSRLMLVSWVGE